MLGSVSPSVVVAPAFAALLARALMLRPLSVRCRQARIAAQERKELEEAVALQCEEALEQGDVDSLEAALELAAVHEVQLPVVAQGRTRLKALQEEKLKREAELARATAALEAALEVGRLRVEPARPLPLGTFPLPRRAHANC